MFSARELLAVVLSGLVLAGCARIDSSRTQQLSPAPILEDEAMTLRQWDQTASLYANGSSVSYPTLYPFVPRGDVPEIEGLLVAPLLFIGQTLFLPITALLTPAWEQETYGGVSTPPTFTAVPVVQPDAGGYARISTWPTPDARMR